MTKGVVTVFGANGFLGRYVLRELAKQGWRIRAAVRRPHTAQDLRVIGRVGQIQLVQANLRYRTSVENAIAGADAVVNVCGILYKKGPQSFHAIHHLGVQMIGEAARKNGITNVAHVSALGAKADAESEYARSKYEGEQALLKAVPSADIFRPSIVFGENDGFFTRFARLAQFSPVLPLIGWGETRFSPVYVGDVAKAIALKITTGTQGKMYELGGPQSYSFKELLVFTTQTIDKKCLLLPIPWLVSKPLGFVGDIVGAIPFVPPFLTRDQVKILRHDNVVSGDYDGLKELGIEGETIEAIIPAALYPYKKYGQFHHSSAG